MSLSRLLKKFSLSQPNLERPAPTDAGGSPSNDDTHKPLGPHRQQASEPTLTILRSWRKKRPSTIGQSSPSQPFTPPLTPGADGPPSEHGPLEMPLPAPFPIIPSVSLATTAEGPPRPLESALNPVPDKLVEAWDAVKDDPRVTNKSRGLDNAGGAVASMLENAAPYVPIIKATAAGAEQTETAKAIKERIDKFSESMPIFMKALDELRSLHPFIGVVVLAFQTVYTLDQKRRDNDKKITSLFIGMRDMMGALFILKDTKNGKLIVPDGLSIEDRLKSLVDRTADDIKLCSNVCDAYMKKRLLAKVMMSSVWDAKLLDFVKLFATRRQEFEFELAMHASQGIDKANAKLDAIGEATRALNEQMNVMKVLFQELVSPEQKRLSELVVAKGRGKVLKDDDKALLELEKVAGKASGLPKAEVGHARREKPNDSDTNLTADNLRRDIFEHPNVAVERNLIVFSRKFEAQKNQLVDELTLVVKRESDRVIQEVKGGPHQRILDRSIYEIWTEMGWRGNVKARHFILALRDSYLERLASGTDNALGMGAAGVNLPSDPDAWAIKYIDVIRLQPILEAIDDDASGFITIGEMNRFTASRPIDWSLPHWVAFWAVGYRESIIDYASKINELFSKMDGLRTEVLPINRNAVTSYFANIWGLVHGLIAPLLSLQPGQDDSEKFQSYLEAEEARLENNLKAVDYIIDGTDTLTLIIGVGRIEKMVFPLLYLMMKHQYEIMRIMRTKVLDSRELSEGATSMLYVRDAIRYRVDDLINNFSHQRLDVQKQFQNFACGMFKYFSDTGAIWSEVWSKDYILGLDPQPISYDDSNEDQGVKLEDILRFKTLDEPSLDYSVYDGHSTDVSSYDNIEPPLKDILGHWHGYFYEGGGNRESEGIDSMMTFVLKPAEGERDFQGNGWSIRGRLNITGSWSMGENNVMNIKFKITTTPSPILSWNTNFFNGHFDPERDALTGVWGFSDDLESSIGPLEFRRIPPRYLVVYPSIKELSDNKSRGLWRFAIAAVRSDIRQRRYFWSHFSQRRDDGKLVVALLVRYNFFGKPLDDEEVRELCAASQRLTPSDACFYASMAYRKRGHTLMHGDIYCDSCGGYVGGPRLFCLDCIDKSNTFATLDLCCTPELRCLDAYVSSREELLPHEPSHKLVKLRIAVPTYHLGLTYKLAHGAFERVQVFLPKIVEASQKSEDEKGTEQDVQNVSTQDPTTRDQPSESDKLDDDQAAMEVELTSTEMVSEIYKSDDVPTAANGIQGGVQAEPTVTKVPSKSDNVTTTTDGTNGKIEMEDRDDNPSQTRAQLQDGDFPACGNCNRSLSFPFWYCIFCEDNLFICDECDSKGVPDVTRSSGKHTEEHHLIRCLKPEQDYQVVDSPEERRLISIESCLADLSSRMGHLEELIHKLVGTAKGN